LNTGHPRTHDFLSKTRQLACVVATRYRSLTRSRDSACEPLLVTVIYRCQPDPNSSHSQSATLKLKNNTRVPYNFFPPLRSRFGNGPSCRIGIGWFSRRTPNAFKQPKYYVFGLPEPFKWLIRGKNSTEKCSTFPPEKTSTCPLQKWQCCRHKQDSLAAQALNTPFKHTITA
jgi:hypothetical protein